MKLEPEQEFKIRELTINIQEMPTEDIKKRLIEIHRINLLLDAKYKPLIREAWGL